MYLMSACGIGLFLVFKFFTTLVMFNYVVGALTIVLIFAFIRWLFKFGSIKKYKRAYKDQIIKKIFSMILPEANYEPENYISSSLFSASGLFSNYDRYSGDDLAVATIGKTEVHVSEVHSEIEVTTTDTEGNTSTHWETQFKGFFIIADFHKHFNGSTFVRPDSFGGIGILNSLSDFVGNIFQSKLETVTLENIKFEEVFKVQSTDQVTARYILTPQMMEGILSFRDSFFGKNIYMSFIDGKVNIAISQSENNFEPGIYKSSINLPVIYQTYDLFENIFGIIDHMNLNTRIWTKK